ncbi:hypothetical protein [Sphingobacterium sp. BIGb0165]|uniref:hypothetical protein n=1 Tax=Sphingobacterium sp. BIGb0165 TaxID=2940615 RepID=UPI0021685CF0|nr:hypothetical protein [Sphingobacterium sp. BIGb0165]MCS4225871.1 hypothetical protein [Sphingobacterium sp. BIGb0165]
MKLYGYLKGLSTVLLLSFNTQQNPIHKKWKLVAEERSYLNFDYTRHEGSRDRLDSIQNETVQFLPDGTFKSGDGNGRYTLTKDSIKLRLNGKERGFKYVLNQSKLIMESDIRESRFILRFRLHMEE